MVGFLTSAVIDATDDEVEAMCALTSLVVARILILISISLNNLSWASTSATLYAAAQAISFEQPSSGAPSNATADSNSIANATEVDCSQAALSDSSPMSIFWITFAVQLTIFMLGSYWIIRRFSLCAEATAKQTLAEKAKRFKFEQKFRSVALSNVLSSAAGVVVFSLKLAVLASFPVADFPVAAMWLALLFLAAGSTSAAFVDHVCDLAPWATSAASQRRWARIAEIWMSGFAWSVGAFVHQAIADAVHLHLSGGLCVAARPDPAPLWLIFGIGVLAALVGFHLVKHALTHLLAAARSVARLSVARLSEAQLLADDVLGSVGGHAGDSTGTFGSRSSDLLRKSLVWTPAIAFNEAMQASLEAAGAPFGGWLYASLVTVLAALLAIAIEWKVRRLLRIGRAKAKGGSDGGGPGATSVGQATSGGDDASLSDQREAALAHDLSNLMTNAIGFVVGLAWGAAITHTINPPVETLSVHVTGSNWSALLVLALTVTAVAVAFAVWVADVMPRRQAKLIVDAPRAASRRRGQAGKEMASIHAPKDAPEQRA